MLEHPGKLHVLVMILHLVRIVVKPYSENHVAVPIIPQKLWTLDNQQGSPLVCAIGRKDLLNHTYYDPSETTRWAPT